MKTFSLLWLGVLTATGCTGSHIGNPSARLSLSLTGYDSPEASGVAIDEAWIALDRVRLRSAEECGRHDDTTDVPAPLAAELVGNEMLPERPELDAEATAYCRIELRFDDLAAGALEGMPPGMSDRSI